jgi:hypothetical protein
MWLKHLGTRISGYALHRGLYDSRNTYLNLRLYDQIEYYERIGVLNRLESKQFVRVFERMLGYLRRPERSLLHGDLGNHKLFANGEEITTLRDWGDVLIGDPFFNVVPCVAFHPVRQHKTFLKGYRLEKALRDDFVYRFSSCFLRAVSAKTVPRHRFGYCDRPERGLASQRIQLGLERLLEALGSI